MDADYHASAEERRAKIQAYAHSIGVTEEYISFLVDSFYERVRADPLLGPVFEEAIGEEWPEHLAKLKRFWSSVALNSGTYSGRPVPVHQVLAHAPVPAHAWHFPIWLGLFRQTLQDTAPTPEAEDYFMVRAERIARTLRLAMFPSHPPEGVGGSGA